MSNEIERNADQLSPISRRAFFRSLGGKALKLGILGTAAASFGADDGGCRINIGYVDANCGYCDGAEQDYEHCDGEYCDYANYSDYADENCGYCDSAGQDYEHCDGEYCDYANYSDEGCGYCDNPGQDYKHCDGEYCDYTNYADA